MKDEIKKCNCSECFNINCENYDDDSLYEVIDGKNIFLIQGKYLDKKELEKYKKIK